jgi:serine/threonine protein kinase
LPEREQEVHRMSSSLSSEKRSYLGKYQIVAHIATGGMGSVYQAVDSDTGREVALKVLSPDLASRPIMRERFRREAVHGVKLCHDNIVGIYEFGEFQGTYFLVMEFVQGANLGDYIDRRGPLAPESARQMLIQIANALHHVHMHGLIHRDIKPTNILLTRKDGQVVAKLADLGLIRETRDEDFRLTREGQTVGTVDYLAPEQARDSGAADIRSDIYSLGCTLFHMLTGKPPFPDGNLTERIFKHVEVEPPDVRNFSPHVPASMAAMCRRMLAKKPADRFQTPAELLETLQNLDVTPDPLPFGSGRRRRDPATAPTKILAAAPREDVASADSGLTTTPVPPSPNQKRRLAAGQLELAKKAIAAGDRRYGIRMLLRCCRLEPSNVAYRQALRENLQRHGDAAPAWPAGWLAGWHKLMLKLAVMLSRPELVLYYGEKVLASCPRDLPTHLQLTEAALARRFWLLAQWLLEQAEEAHGPHVRIRRAQAILRERQGDMEQAMELWEMVDRADPGNSEARRHLQDLAARETLVKNQFQDRFAAPHPGTVGRNSAT